MFIGHWSYLFVIAVSCIRFILYVNDLEPFILSITCAIFQKLCYFKILQKLSFIQNSFIL